MKSKDSQSIIIQSTGAYLPNKILTNCELSKIVDTSDEWIRTRTGISERRIADASETTAYMAIQASKDALNKANLHPVDIDLLIIGTITPEKLCPSTAGIVQNALGLRQIPCFDLSAACSGYLYIQEVAVSMMRNNGYKHALIIGSEKMSSILNWSDRTTCVLFGDGAGAAILSKHSEPDVGILDSILKADGAQSAILEVSTLSESTEELSNSSILDKPYLRMNGREVFKLAVRSMGQICLELLDQNNLTTHCIHHIIAHQANIRIIESLAQKLEIPIERFVCNLNTVGNTSAASIPLALDSALNNKLVNPGELILMVSFGGGLTWGAALIKWHSYLT